MVAYTNDLRLSELATGEGSGTWGTTTNTNLELIAEAFSFGTEAITTNADTHTTTIADGSTDPGRSLFLKYTGTLDSTCTITIGPNTVSKLWFIENATSGSQDIIISQGSGANVTIANGQTKAIYSDGAGSGAAMVDAFQDLSVPDLFIDDDLTFTSDSAVITFGADGDTTLTHTDGTGLTLNGTNKLTFGDAASFVQQSSDGVLRVDGEATIDLNASTAVTVSNDLKLDSDSAVLGFGADNDTTLTHTDGSGLTLNSTNKIMFNDASQFIQGSSATVLSLGATDEIDLTATLIDINGNADVTGTVTATKLVSADGVLELDDNGTHNGIINSPASLIINIDSDSNSTGEDFIIAKDRTSTSGGTELFRVQEDGNVGIGTSSPSSRIHIQNDSDTDYTATNFCTAPSATISNTTSGALNYASLLFSTEANGEFAIGAVQNSGNTASDFVFASRTSGTRTERMRIDSSGNVGINTSSPQAKLDVSGVGNFSTGYNTFTGDGLHIQCSGTGGNGNYTGGISFSRISADNNSRAAGIAGVQGADADQVGLAFFTHSSATTTASLVEAMRIDSSGNVGIGNSSGVGKLEVFANNTAPAAYIRQDGTGPIQSWHIAAGAEKMRLTSGGDLLVGTTTSFGLLSVRDASGSSVSVTARFLGGASNDSLLIRGDGDAENTNNSYGAISDVRVKENIVDASPKLADLMRVQVRNYNLIGTTHKQIGVVAQELEQVFPGMIKESPEIDTNGQETGETRKSVKYSVFVPMLIKAMQEQQETITALETRITQLENN